MECLSKSFTVSFAEVIFESAQVEQSEYLSCVKICSGMVVSVVAAPIEAIIRIALGIFTSIAFLGLVAGGETGKKFAAIPKNFFSSGFDNFVYAKEIALEIFSVFSGLASLCWRKIV
jgi:hypothetical protein